MNRLISEDVVTSTTWGNSTFYILPSSIDVDCSACKSLILKGCSSCLEVYKQLFSFSWCLDCVYSSEYPPFKLLNQRISMEECRRLCESNPCNAIHLTKGLT